MGARARTHEGVFCPAPATIANWLIWRDGHERSRAWPLLPQAGQGGAEGGGAAHHQPARQNPPMTPRFHTDQALAPGAELALPDNAARHVQVLRLQPGAAITLFNGLGGEWQAQIVAMGRKAVTVRLLAHQPSECELAWPVTLAVGMPANERMDGLVEKATELGVAQIQPLVCERSVLRLAGERAERKAAHWQAVAAAACEQSGRNRLPAVAAPVLLRDWLAALPAPARLATPPTLSTLPNPQGLNTLATPAPQRLLLSLAPGAAPLAASLAGLGRPGLRATITVLSGPEGGFSPAELALAQAAGFCPVSLGPRVLRADTAPLAALAAIACWAALETAP